MHWNTGYLREAVPIIRHFVKVYQDAETVVVPSSSCVAMMRDHYLKAAEMDGDAKLAADVEALLPRVYEFSEFLVRKLGIEDVGAVYPHKVTYHASCHSMRSLHLGDIPIRLAESRCVGWRCSRFRISRSAVDLAERLRSRMRMFLRRCWRIRCGMC